MSTPSNPADERDDLGRIPRDRLRHWSSYATAGEFWADYRGYVPTQMMAGISEAQRRHGWTFTEAYGALLAAGAIIHLDDEPDAPDAAG